MGNQMERFFLGIDIGSTTAKAVLLNDAGVTLYETYQRHYADVRKTIYGILEEIHGIIKDTPVSMAITGSGGLNLSKSLNVLFFLLAS